jgi:hypothetical protein
MKEKEKYMYLINDVCPLQSPRLSFDPELPDRSCKTKKVQKNSYSTDISSNIDPSTANKLIWNKHKFERNKPNIDY